METPQNALNLLRVLPTRTAIISFILTIAFLLSILNFDVGMDTDVNRGSVIFFFVQCILLALNYRQVLMTCRICERFFQQEVFEENINVSSHAECNEDVIHSTRFSAQSLVMKEEPTTKAVDDASATKEKPATKAVDDASATKEKPATKAVDDASATKEKPATKAVDDTSATKEKPAIEVVEDASTAMEKSATEVVEDASATKENSIIVTKQSSSDEEIVLEDDTRRYEVSSTTYLSKILETLKIASGFYPEKSPDLSIAEKLTQNSKIDLSSQMFQSDEFNKLAQTMQECENFNPNSQNISQNVTRECRKPCTTDVRENEPLLTEMLSCKPGFQPAVKPKADTKAAMETTARLYEGKTPEKQIDEPKSEVVKPMPRIPMKLYPLPKIPKKEYAIKQTKKWIEPIISVNEILNFTQGPLIPEHESLISRPYDRNWNLPKIRGVAMFPSSEDMLQIYLGI